MSIPVNTGEYFRVSDFLAVLRVPVILTLLSTQPLTETSTRNLPGG
jgi:hypothetical protein